ncbi:MAG: sulfotransferase [Deltaproteobacteria bacterium]
MRFDLARITRFYLIESKELWVNSQYWEKEEDLKQGLGERVISYFIGKYVKIRYRIWMFRKEANESALHPEDLSRICLQHVLPVTSPLVLISQIQGSGGSFLNQLFDGHSELHTHPHELIIGYPEKDHWPKVDLNDRPENWFGLLFEDVVSKYNQHGYVTGKGDKETFPFVFIPPLQRKIFLDYMNSAQSITTRHVFDGYLTSYFGAWLNNQNYSGQKKFITAYSPRLAIIKENMELFFETYPDGRLISLIRAPQDWLPFARIHWPEKYDDVRVSLERWNECTQAMLWNKEKYGDRVCLIKFEDLLSKTEPVMRYLADFLSIEFDDILLVPTFNRFPLKVDTRSTTEDHGIVDGTLSKARTSAGQQLGGIEGAANENYSLAVEEAVRFE